MRKILYSALSLFVVWFASTACFPIYVGTSRPELTPCPTSGSDPGNLDVPCDPTSTPTPLAVPVPESSPSGAVAP